MSVVKKVNRRALTLFQARLTDTQLKELRYIGRKRGLIDPRTRKPNMAEVVRTLIEEEARRLRR